MAIVMKKSRATKAKITAYIATFTALVFAATSVIVVETPATKGFFNLGETMVYTAALLGGIVVGTIAGGLGSALADLYLGYPHYAPGTLIIKGIEGFIVAHLSSRFRRLNIAQWKVVSVISAIIAFGLVAGLGYTYYRGETILYFLGSEVEFSIPGELWFILGALLSLGILYLGFKYDPKVGGDVYAIILGGLEMVLGYFTYQVVVLRYPPMVAALEIPVNLGQATIGLLVALPLARTIKAMGAKVET